MKMTTRVINETVLADVEPKLTTDDRASVWNYAGRRFGRHPWGRPDDVLREAAAMLAHYGWPWRVTQQVVAAIIYGAPGRRRVCVQCGGGLPKEVAGLYCTRHGGRERLGDLLPEAPGGSGWGDDPWAR